MTVIPTEKLITIFGGSGFVGRHIVRELAKAGWRIRVAVRHPHTAYFLRPMGRVGQIQIVKADILKEATIAQAVDGAEIVVNLVGTLKRFNQIHVDAAACIAKNAKTRGASRLVHFSVIGADNTAPARYYRSKAEGESKVSEIFPEATIIRPSIIFGPEDYFFNRFAALIRLVPLGFPLFGRGATRFQPVFVGDIARGTTAALNRAETQGQTFEFAGPEIMTLRQVIEFILRETRRSRTLITVPMAPTKLLGAVMQIFPNAPLTLDQARMLETDTVLSGAKPGLRDLGINPTAVEAIVSSYLWRFRKLGQFAAVPQ
ncbi:MAG: complex I NDUFA9 subunit family protein [Micropepsaceae bacterium]